MKWRVLPLICITTYRITQERYSIFSSMIVKSTPVFPVFSVGVKSVGVKSVQGQYFVLIFSDTS